MSELPTEIWIDITVPDDLVILEYRIQGDESYTLTSTIDDKNKTIRKLAEALEKARFHSNHGVTFNVMGGKGFIQAVAAREHCDIALKDNAKQIEGAKDNA